MGPLPSQHATFEVTEIFLSVQGESTWAGMPCVFVRLTGCPLRCSYCDSTYAYKGGEIMDLDEVLGQVLQTGCKLVEVTGGEPLAQEGCIALLQRLLDNGLTVLLETSGAQSIRNVPPQVIRIVDFKCPSSGEQQKNDYENLRLLAAHDEVKFVMGTREDYEWAREMVRRHNLPAKCRCVLFSCVFGQLQPAELVRWLLEDKLFAVRVQLQVQKHIWPPGKRGV